MDGHWVGHVHFIKHFKLRWDNGCGRIEPLIEFESCSYCRWVLEKSYRKWINNVDFETINKEDLKFIKEHKPQHYRKILTKCIASKL